MCGACTDILGKGKAGSQDLMQDKIPRWQLDLETSPSWISILRKNRGNDKAIGYEADEVNVVEKKLSC